MEMRNCKKCGKVFASFGDKVCVDCKREEDELFTKVKEYIYDHPRASIKEVSRETEVDEDIILRYMREGRIEVADDSLSTLTCEKCGKIIRTGKYCVDCQKKLYNTLNTAMTMSKMEDKQSGPRMYSENLRKEED